MNTAQRIAKNFFSLAAANIIASLLGFVATVYLARVLGPGGFGQIYFAIAIIAYFMLIANLGLPMLGTREIARDKNKIKDYVGNIVALRLTLAAIAFCLLLLFAFLIQKPTEIKYLIILYGLGLFPFALQLLWLFRGIEKMEYMAGSQIAGGVLYVASILYFIKSPEQLLAVPVIYVICTAFLPAVFLIFFSIRHFGRIPLKFDAPFWGSLLRQALPMGFAFVIAELYFHFDTVMLGFMRSNEEVGYYNAAYRIILLFVGLGGLYHVTIFPIISNYYKTSLASLHRLLSLTAKLTVTISLPLAAGGTMLAKSIMNFIYPPEYGSGIIALQILIWVIPVRLIGSVYGNSLIACDRQSRFAIGVTIGAIINIVLNAILIPRFGIVAAAAITVVTLGAVVLYNYRQINKIVSVPFKGYLLRPLVACFGMAAFLYFGSGWNMWLLIALAALLYFALLFIIGGITKEDIRLIKEQFRR
ncbi:flippase [Chloroflexota bacterium]